MAKSVGENIQWILGDSESMRLISKFAGVVYGVLLTIFAGLLIWLGLRGNEGNVSGGDITAFIVAALFLWKALGCYKMAWNAIQLDRTEKKIRR